MLFVMPLFVCKCIFMILNTTNNIYHKYTYKYIHVHVILCCSTWHSITAVHKMVLVTEMIPMFVWINDGTEAATSLPFFIFFCFFFHRVHPFVVWHHHIIYRICKSHFMFKEQYAIYLIWKLLGFQFHFMRAIYLCKRNGKALSHHHIQIQKRIVCILCFKNNFNCFPLNWMNCIPFSFSYQWSRQVSCTYFLSIPSPPQMCISCFIVHGDGDV